MSSAIRATASYSKDMARKALAPAAAPTTPWRYRDAGDDYGATASPDWRQTNWAEELKKVEVDGTPINYVDVGSAGLHEPVVLVHGLGGQWQNWLENIPRLAQERRVLALDLPGSRAHTGAGRWEDQHLGLRALRRRVLRAARPRQGRARGQLHGRLHLGRGRHPVPGAGLAARAGLRRRDLVAPTRSSAPVLLFGRIAAAIATNTAARHRSLAARPITRHSSLLLVARHPRLLKADLAYEGFFKGAGKPGFDDALRACLDYDFRDRLPDVKVPTLIVWGEKDSIIPVRDANEFERLIATAARS